MAQESRLVIRVDSKSAKMSVDELAREMIFLEAAGVRVTRGNTNVSSSMGQMASEANAAASSIKRGLITVLGGLSAMSVIDIADEWGQYASRIRMATKSAEEYEHVQRRMLKSGQMTYRAIDETRESFIQMSPVLRDMGLSLDQSIDAVDTFSGLLVVNGANAERGAAAMNALSKSLQRGKVDVEAWMTIYTTADTIIDSLSESSGRTAEAIRAMGTEGEISAEMMAKALVEGNEKVMKAVAGMPTTVRDAMQNISSSFGEYIGRVNEANQVTATLASGIDALGENLDTVLTVAIVGATTGLVRYSGGIAAAAGQTAIKAVQSRLAAAEELKLAQAQVATATASLAQARALGTVTVNMAQQTAAATALEAANKRLAAAQVTAAAASRAALSILGGPVGLGVTAALTAASFLAFRDSADEASVHTQGLTHELNLLTEAADKLTAAQSKQAMAQTESLYEKAKDEAMKYRAQVEYLTAQLDRYPSSAMVKEWNADLVQAEGNVDTASQKVAQYEARLAELQARLDAVTGSQGNANLTIGGLPEAVQKQMAFLDRRIALFGQTGQAAQVYYDLEHGALKDLEPEHKRQIRDQADILAGKERSAEASRKVAGGIKKETSEVHSLISSLFPAIQAEKEWVKHQKLLDQALKQGKITQEQHTKGLIKLRDAYELITFAAPEHVKAIQDEAKSMKSSIPALRDRVRHFGLSAAAISLSAETETKARIATLNNVKAMEVAKGASAEYVKQIEQEIDALKDLLIQQEHQTGLLDKQERLEAEQRYYQDVADEAKRTHEEIERSLTDALMRGFESGKDFGKNFIDTLKNMFGSLVLRPIIQPIAAGAAGMITGGFSGAAQAQGTGSGAGGLLSSFSPLTGFAGSASGLVQSVGSSLASINGSLGDFGANIVMNADKIGGALDMAGAGIAYGASLYQLTQGKWGAGLGGAAGQFLGGPIGSFIGSQLGGMLDGAFKGETRGGGYYQYDLERQTAARMGGASGEHGGAKTEAALAQLFGASQATIDSVFRGLGVDAGVSFMHGMFEDSKKGRGGVFSGGHLRVGEQQLDFGTNKKGAGYGGKSGSLEEMFENLQKDLAFSTLEAWQSVSDQMPLVIGDMLNGIDIRSLSAEHAQAAVVDINAITNQVTTLTAALNTLPLEAIKDLSFDLAYSLGQASGGMDVLAANSAVFYQGFYSEAEKQAHLQGQIRDALAAVNLQLPSSREGYRQLVESLDATDTSTHAAIAGLFSLSGAADQFYTVTEQAAAALAEEASRRLEEQLQLEQQVQDERERLERQVLSLTGDSVAIRALELDALDVSNHALQEHIWALQDEAEAAQIAAGVSRERFSLESQLLQLEGDTAALRARQLDGLDASNHALQEHIWALQDEAGAVKSAAEAAKSAAEAAKAIADQQRALWDGLVSGAQTAYSDLTNAISAERESIQKEADQIAKSLGNAISKASDKVGELDGLARSLASSVSSMMRGGLDESRNRAWAQNKVGQSLSVARLTGVMPQGEDFEHALRIVAEPSEGLFNNFEDYQSDFLRTAHEVDALRLLADDQLTIERKTLSAIEDQLAQSQNWKDEEMTRLDAQLERWREQIDLASGTYRATLSVVDAVSGVQGAIKALGLAINPSAGSAFASYAVGTSYVPHDMTANIHRGEMIIDPQSSQVLRKYGIGLQGPSGSGNDEIVKLLRQEIKELRLMLERKLGDIDKNTYETSRTNRQLTEQTQDVNVKNVVPVVTAIIGQ